jgi:hypothetical protein
VLADDKAEEGSLRGKCTIDECVEDIFTVSIDQIVDVSEYSTVEIILVAIHEAVWWVSTYHMVVEG